MFGSVRDYNPQTLSCCQVATHLTDAIYDTYQNTASFTVDGSGAGVETTVQRVLGFPQQFPAGRSVAYGRTRMTDKVIHITSCTQFPLPLEYCRRSRRGGRDHSTGSPQGYPTISSWTGLPSLSLRLLPTLQQVKSIEFILYHILYESMNSSFLSFKKKIK